MSELKAFKTSTGLNFIGTGPVLELNDKTYRDAVIRAITKHASTEVMYQWRITLGDTVLINYAREHWDELAPLVIRERMCS